MYLKLAERLITALGRIQPPYSLTQPIHPSTIALFAIVKLPSVLDRLNHISPVRNKTPTDSGERFVGLIPINSMRRRGVFAGFPQREQHPGGKQAKGHGQREYWWYFAIEHKVAQENLRADKH